MSRGSNYPAGGTPQSSQLIWFEQKVKEQEARIEVLEKALVKSDEDYEQMKQDYWKLVEKVRENSGWEK